MQKKQSKKTQKNKPKGKVIVKDKLHGSNHTVIETKGDSTQEENPLNRMRLKDQYMVDKKTVSIAEYENPLPKGFKTADTLTPEDDLQFQIDKLTTRLSCWLEKVELNGKTLHCLVDPLNRKLEISEKPLHE